jgi:hypothetical protein
MNQFLVHSLPGGSDAARRARRRPARPTAMPRRASDTGVVSPCRSPPTLRRFLMSHLGLTILLVTLTALAVSCAAKPTGACYYSNKDYGVYTTFQWYRYCSNDFEKDDCRSLAEDNCFALVCQMDDWEEGATCEKEHNGYLYDIL